MLPCTIRVHPRSGPGLRQLHLTCVLRAPKKLAKKLVSDVLKAPASISLKRHEYSHWDDDIGVRPQRKYREDLDSSILPRAKKILHQQSATHAGTSQKPPKHARSAQFEPSVPKRKSSTPRTEASNRRAYLSWPETPPKSRSKAKDGAKISRAADRPGRERKTGDTSKARAHGRATKAAPNRGNVVARGRGGLAALIQAEAPDAAQIPRLAHALDRVLFSPGVQFLQDPRTRVFNFSPYLKNIVSLDNFDMSKVSGFVAANKDAVLLAQAAKHGKTYYSSTLSMTLTLHQMYLFLNNYAAGAVHRFDFPPFSRTAETLPLSVIVEPKGTNAQTGEAIYSVTSDKSADTEIMLGALGHCLEAFLTTEEEQFGHYLKEGDTEGNAAEAADQGAETKGDQAASAANASADTKSTGPESGAGAEAGANVYNYLACGAFLMRSQLDCFDPRLPGNGTFDLKTRAACAVRYDRDAPHPPAYQIWKQHGRFELFDREFADLVRTGALLKYAFQARIGQMDGVFVAYHNVASFFGFQYLPLAELDRIFYTDTNVARRAELHHDIVRPPAVGSEADPAEPPLSDGLPDDHLASHVAETQFKASLALWLDLMDQVRADLPPEHAGRAFRLVLKRKPARDSARSCLYAWAIPVDARDVEQLQAPPPFATLFRAPAAERALGLEAVQRHLDTMNADLVARMPVLEYRVRARALANGRPLDTRHPYPPHSHTRLEYEYEIERVDEPTELHGLRDETALSNNNPAGHPGGHPAPKAQQPDKNTRSQNLEPLRAARRVLAQLRALSRMLTAFRPRASMSIVDQMRGYSRVGARRSAGWRAREAPPVVYTPLGRSAT